MTLLLRLAVIWIVLGAVTGLVLRGQFRERVMIPFALSFLPFAVHLFYLVYRTGGAVTQGQLALFIGISLFLAVAVFWVGLRSAERGGNSVVALPALLALVYGAGPLLWYSSLQRQAEWGVDSIPNVLYVGGTMFVVVMLLVFKARFGSGNRVQRPRQPGE